MHRLLHLQKHAHTGKIIAHRHTSYRSLFVIVAMFSLVLAGFQQSVGADEITISAKIAAPIPTQPAVIERPVTGTVTDSPIITVTGTCQIMDPTIIIAIESGNGLLGSTVCSDAGTFSIPVTLQTGENQLTARSVNITDDYGPNSATVTVTYTPKTTAVAQHIPDGVTPTNNTPIAGEGTSIAKLRILSKYSYITYGPNKNAAWVGFFEGGVSPYFVSIDWGDGLTTTRRNVDTTEQSIDHRYETYATYFITVTVTDKDGRSLQQQLAAVTPYIPQVGSAANISSSTPLISERMLILAIYVCVFLLIGLGVLAFTSVHTVAPVHRTPAGFHKAKRSKHAGAHK